MNYKKIRQESGLTQSYIADFVGISTRHYQRVENGETKPSRSLENLLGIIFDKIKRDNFKKIKEFEKSINEGGGYERHIG